MGYSITMTNEDYISKSHIYPEWLLTSAEFLTVVACLWLAYEGLKLFVFFFNHKEKLSKLLSLEFMTKVLVAVMTLLMGTFLFFDYVEGVNTIVVLRPVFIGLSAYALHKLYAFYKHGV